MNRNISFSGVYIWNKIQDHINVYSTYSTFIFKDALKSLLLVHDSCSCVNKISYTIFLYVIIYLIFVVSQHCLDLRLLNKCWIYDIVRHKQVVMLICFTSILIRHYIFVFFYVVNSCIICFSLLVCCISCRSFFYIIFNYVMFKKPARVLVPRLLEVFYVDWTKSTKIFDGFKVGEGVDF